MSAQDIEKKWKAQGQELFDSCEKLRLLLDNEAAEWVMSRASRRAFQRKLNAFQKAIDDKFDVTVDEPK